MNPPAKPGACRDWALRFVLHVITGALAVAAHYVVMAACMHLGLGPVVASATGFCAGAVTRFYTAYAHVYAPRDSARAIAPRFVLALAAQFVVNALLLEGLMRVGMPVWWAQVLTTGLLTVANYLVYRLLVFV